MSLKRNAKGGRKLPENIQKRAQQRPTLLTPIVQQKLLEAASSGLKNKQAAYYAGISPITLLEWLRRGEGNDTSREQTKLYAEFAKKYRQARAVLVRQCVEDIRQFKGDGEWRARAWLAEKLAPDELTEKGVNFFENKEDEKPGSEDLMALLAQIPMDVLKAVLDKKCADNAS